MSIHRTSSALLLAMVASACVGDSRHDPPAPASSASTTDDGAAADAAVAAHLALLTTEPEDFEAQYSVSIARLRKVPRASVKTLTELYRAAPKEHYMGRWGMVHTIGEVGSDHAVAPLLDIALRTPHGATGSRVSAPVETGPAFEEEAMVQLRAIEGLGALALAGNLTAEEALRTCIREGDAHLRAAAAHAYLSGGRRTEARVSEVRALLPESAKALADIRAATPADFAITPPTDVPSRKKPKSRGPRPMPVIDVQR